MDSRREARKPFGYHGARSGVNPRIRLTRVRAYRRIIMSDPKLTLVYISGCLRGIVDLRKHELPEDILEFLSMLADKADAASGYTSMFHPTKEKEKPF